MIYNFIIILYFYLLCCSCSTQMKTYHDFSLLQNDVVVVDKLVEQRNQTTAMHPPKDIWTWTDIPHHYQEETWTWVGQLSPIYDLGYSMYSESDSLFIFYEKDTLLLNDMLGPDSIYLEWFYPLHLLGGEPVYKLKNRISGEQLLYISFGRDGLGNRPGYRINLVFPLLADNRIEGGFEYVTSTFTREDDPCLDCFTDFNHDGKIDFIRWTCSYEGTPVRYISFSENGHRTYHSSRLKSVIICGGPLYWEFIRKNQRLPKDACRE